MFSALTSICQHSKTSRINDNFIKCLDCGQSVVSNNKSYTNKGMQNFVSENKSFQRNFDRNFRNDIIEGEEKGPIEMFADAQFVNVIIVDRTPLYGTTPPKYKIIFNGESLYLTNDHIANLLQRTKSRRVQMK
jgi:hypothetical protein